MILDKTYELLRSRYNDQIDNLLLSDVRVGLFLTAVRLSDGSCGVASTLSDYNIHCAKENRDFSEFTPSKIAGSKVTHLLETTKKSHIIDSLRIAVLNALSSRCISESDYRIIEDKDPVDLLELDSDVNSLTGSNKTITIVGGFHSYIRKISETKNRLFVLELDEDVLPQEHKQYFVRADEFRSVLTVSDIIIITGFTLVNNTIDGLLESIPSHARVIVTGPSSSIIPDVLFKYGVNIIGATRITDPDLLFKIVGEAGAGFHLFHYCAQKICILNE